jgi:hypothetical protein
LIGLKIQSEWTMLLEEKAVRFKWVCVLSYDIMNTLTMEKQALCFWNWTIVATVCGSPCCLVDRRMTWCLDMELTQHHLLHQESMFLFFLTTSNSNVF